LANDDKVIKLKNENKVSSYTAQNAGKFKSNAMNQNSTNTKPFHMKSVSHQTVSGSTSSASVMVLDKKSINFNTTTKVDITN
jgi:hypothetical protein